MGLFKRRRKKSEKNMDEILEQVAEDVLSPEDRGDTHKVQHYVLGHCEQIIETAKELEEEKSEYRVVTAYLKDIQIIEELPDEEATVLRDTAANIITLDRTRTDYLHTSKKITDSQYTQMQRDEKVIATAIKNLQSNEVYQSAVKRDMHYLEGEKNEWMYYREELENEQKILRRLSYALFGILLVLLTVVLVLQVGFYVDMQLIFLLLIFVAAAGGMFVFLRMQYNTKEMQRAEVNMNHAITLSNKVKIKYVNSTNAVDYACEKYHVHNSFELNYLWEQYMGAVREREKYERTSEDLEYFHGKLVRMLRKYELFDSKVWINQTVALVDKREMVEIKHNLVARRQKLRGRIEYNMDVVLEQKEEIENLMKEFKEDIPEVHEILESVEKLCGIN